VNLALLLACAVDAEGAGDSAAAPLDLRLAEGDFAPADVTIWGPEVVVAAGEDATHCIAGTWIAGDVGIHSLNTWQNRFGHHAQFFRLIATTLDYPDGESFPCGPGTAFNMTDTQPAGLPTSVHIGDEQTIDQPLDEGMAFSFDGDSRFLLQAHYVNTGAEDILVHDLVTVGVLDPESEVSTWVAPLILNNSNIDVPPASPASMTFDCPMDLPASALSVRFVNGHMHEWGTSLRITQLRGEESRVLTEIEEWEPAYRDSPPTIEFAPGELELEDGDVLRTECAWFNDTDAPLRFPQEMCDGVALVYPQKSTTICDAETGMNP
jgi:hypothetical protein